MSLVRNTAISAAATVIGTIGRLLITVHVARTLGPTAYGLLVFTQWCAETLAIVSNLGLPSALTRYAVELRSVSESDRQSRLTFFACAAALAFVLAGVLSLTLFWWIDQGTTTSSYILSIAWTLAALALLLANAFAFGLLRFDLVLLSNVVYVAVGLVAAHLLVERGNAQSAMSVWILASASAATVNVVFLASDAVSEVVNVELTITPLRELYSYALNTWIGSLTASILWTRGELGVLRSLVDSRGIATYGVATTVSGLVIQAVSLFQGAITPHLAASWKRNDKVQVERMLRSLSNITFFVSVAGAFSLTIFGSEIVTLLFGSQFVSAAGPLAIIAVGATAAGTGSVNMAVQLATNGRFQRDANFVGAASLIVVAALLIPHFGLLGAAMGRAITVSGIGVVVVWRLAAAGYPNLSRSLLWRWVSATSLIVGAGVVAHSGYSSYVLRGVLFVGGIVAGASLFVSSEDIRTIRSARLFRA